MDHFEFSDDESVDGIIADSGIDSPVVSHERCLHMPSNVVYADMCKFISNAQTRYMDHYNNSNTLHDNFDEVLASYKSTDDRSIQKYDNHNVLVEEYTTKYSTCSIEQKQCLDNIQAALQRDSIPTGTELIMFISGAGGTGKSHVIHLSGVLCKITLGKGRGMFGPQVALGPTGSSANGIRGFTYHSVLSE